MAKKRKPDRRKPRERPRPAPSGAPDFPDPRVLEGAMREMLGDLAGMGNEPPELRQAQALIYQAYEEPDPQERIALARQALQASPDCADAYLLLAEHSRNHKQALELHRQAVAAGERALGQAMFEEHAGHFWGIMETRPYMRARMEWALSLWRDGQRDEAVRQLQDMLRLNPNDNQGIRYTLVGLLAFLDRRQELADLIERYSDDGSAWWAWTKALLAFRQEGDTIDSRRLLKAAKKVNPHVADFLLGRMRPPSDKPDYHGRGDEAEAVHYIAGSLPAWKDTAGAIAWVRGNDEKIRRRKKDVPHGKGPLTFVKKWLLERLPATEDVWQADYRRMPNWIGIAGDPVRLWIILVTSRTNDLVLAHLLVEDEPSAELLWDTLVQAMQHPIAGETHRPRRLEVLQSEQWDKLRGDIEEIGVELSSLGELEQLDFVYQDMAEHICAKPEPGLLDVPGVTPEQAAGFFDAAAYFYQQAPWKRTGYETPIKVECDKFTSGPYYAVLMGQLGETMGLAVYDDLQTLQRMWSDNASDEEHARQSPSTVVIYGEEWEVPVADLDAARRSGWKVARSDAYPHVCRKEFGLSKRPPLAWELELMEGCLRAIPGFVERHRQDDSAREEVTVPTALGELKLGLSWVVDAGEL